MSVMLKVLAAFVVVMVVAGAGTLGVMAVTAEERPEVIAVRSESPRPSVTATPDVVEPDDRRLWPDEARRARRAALAETGGGVVSELDRSDDPGEAYEVEVIKGGREYDVALDLDFEVVPNRRYDD